MINRFRGDIALLQGGLDWLAAYTGKPVLGVLPYLHGLHLDAEDAVPITPQSAYHSGKLSVIVPRLPHISNHTDFEPLRLHPQVTFHYVGHEEPIPAADLIILPGSKNVGFDLAWLKAQGWEHALQRHLRYGGKVIGICGGLQMLGTAIHDPHGLEGSPTTHHGFGLLDLTTTLQPEKQLTNRSGTLAPSLLTGVLDGAVQGYEIHCGISSGKALAKPALYLEGQADGAISTDGQILATYLHGLFDSPSALSALLAWAGLATAETFDINQLREQQLERLADTFEQHLDMAAVMRLVGVSCA